MSRPHEPTDACGDSHCFSCGVDEPIPMGSQPYLVCFECGHVYWTPRDLLRAYRRNLRREWRISGMRPRPYPSPYAPSWWAWLVHYVRAYPISRAETIAFCQECIHDF